MLVFVLHKMRNYAVLLRSRAKQKYTNKCDARAKLLFCLLNLLFFWRFGCPPYWRVDVNRQNWPIEGYRVFSLTWPASMQIYWDKRKSLHKKRVQLPKDWFGTPTWPPFHCFETPIWPPWRHVKTLCTRSWFIRMRYWKQWALSIRQKTSGMNFRQFPVANGTAFSKISNTEHNLVRNTQIFENSFR